MLTGHIDCPTPQIRRSGSFTTISWESGLSIQLDAEEWHALTEAIDDARFERIEKQNSPLIRDENTIRIEADIREALQ